MADKTIRIKRENQEQAIGVARERVTVRSVTSYEQLDDLPQINGVALEGDKSLEDLGITDAIDDALEDYTPTSGFAEVAFTGDYDDLIGTPTIPTVNNATLTITQNGTSAGTFTANASSNTTINLTDTTYSAFSGATPSAAGASGLVPAPVAGDGGKALKGDGTWGVVGNVVELFIEADPDSLPSSFEIYKDSGKTTPITWTELRSLFTPSNEKTVVLHSTTAGDGVYPVVTYYYNTTEFNIFDAYSNATYYIHGASGGSPTGFTIEQTDLQERLTAGTGISITDGVISATNGVSVVQTTGQSTTAVMSQKAVTDAIGGGGAIAPLSDYIDGNWAITDKEGLISAIEDGKGFYLGDPQGRTAVILGGAVTDGKIAISTSPMLDGHGGQLIQMSVTYDEATGEPVAQSTYVFTYPHVTDVGYGYSMLNLGKLTLNIGSDTYEYDGSQDVNITIADGEDMGF